MNSTGLAPSCSVAIRNISRRKGSSASRNSTGLTSFSWLKGVACIDASVITLQVHACIKRTDFLIPVEHEGLTLPGEQAVFPYAPLAGLRPTRMADIRIYIGVEAIFTGCGEIPGSPGLLASEADFYQ